MRHLLFLVLSVCLFGQTTRIYEIDSENTVVALSIPITLSKATTNYSSEFDLYPYLKNDSSAYVANIMWQSNDTVQVTVSLDVKNHLLPTGTAGTWVSHALSGASPQANAGNDTLYTRSIRERGVVPAGVTDVISLSGRVGTKARLKVVFANPTTVGNSGTFRVWALLKKNK